LLLLLSAAAPATLQAEEPGRLPGAKARPLWTAKHSGTPTLSSRRSTPAAPIATSTSDSGNRLQWRPRYPHRVTANLNQVQSEARQVANEEEITGLNAPVLPSTRQAAPLSRVDPFKDPFGDKRVAQRPEPGDGGFRPLPTPGVDSAAPNPADDAPLPPARGSLDEQMRALGSENGADTEAAEAGDTPKPKCDNIFNERNCCDESDKCSTVRATLLGAPITQISLNITPRFKPDAENVEEGDRLRDAQLAKTEARQWSNRHGSPLGSGRLVDFVNGRAVIETSGGRRLFEYRDLSETDRCFVDAWWDLPHECDFGDAVYGGRNWMASTFTWKASALCHKPLYFEEIQLERYGHTAGPWVQPFISGAHFFVNVATLPYHAGINPPRECQYALGYYRPGSCAPWLLNPIPLSLRGAAVQAAAVTGVAILIP